MDPNLRSDDIHSRTRQPASTASLQIERTPSSCFQDTLKSVGVVNDPDDNEEYPNNHQKHRVSISDGGAACTYSQYAGTVKKRNNSLVVY